MKYEAIWLRNAYILPVVIGKAEGFWKSELVTLSATVFVGGEEGIAGGEEESRRVTAKRCKTRSRMYPERWDGIEEMFQLCEKQSGENDPMGIFVGMVWGRKWEDGKGECYNKSDFPLKGGFGYIVVKRAGMVPELYNIRRDERRVKPPFKVRRGFNSCYTPYVSSYLYAVYSFDGVRNHTYEDGHPMI